MKNARALRDERSKIVDRMRALIDKATFETRDFNHDEFIQYQEMKQQAESMNREIERMERTHFPGPVYLRSGLGDSETRAMAAYVKRGDRGAVETVQDEGGYHVQLNLPVGFEARANDTIMNVTTAADGQAAVPTGLANMIAARRNAVRISDRLGCLPVPGRGTTVNFPFENADPNVFATTSEQADNHANTYERDAPTLGTKAFTLVKYTKKLELTEELLDDEDANLMFFIGDHIGRAIALSHNALCLAEAASTGTSVTSAGTTLAATDPEKLAYHSTIGYYLDDAGSIGWVMRPATLGAIRNITGNSRLYGDQIANSAGENLMNYKVVYSNSAAAVAASAKPVYFGNWRFMGMREDPALRLIRDPYSVDGLVILKFSFRAVYGLLIAGAVGFLSQPSA